MDLNVVYVLPLMQFLIDTGADNATEVSFNSSLYYISQDKMPFEEAQANCELKNATLTVINSDGENEFLRKHMEKYSQYWVWLVKSECTSPGTTEFYWGADCRTPGDLWWIEDEPNSIGWCARYVRMYSLSDKGRHYIAERECSIKYRFICEKIKYHSTTTVLLTKTSGVDYANKSTSIGDCLCPCHLLQSNVQTAKDALTLEQKIAKLKLSMEIDKKTTSNYQRRLVSVENTRTMSVAIGGVGLFVICFVVGGIVLLDTAHFIQAFHNIKLYFIHKE